METVIPPDKKSGHDIRKYRFKTLAADIDEQQSEGGVQAYAFKELGKEEVAGPETPSDERDEELAVPASEPEEPEAEGMPVGGGAAEDLLKRIDELSTDLVKVQMALEKKETECEASIEKARNEGYEAGLEAGRAACMEEVDKEMQPVRERLAASIKALEESRELFLKKVDTIEEELIETALDLARQVVVKEIEKDSREVALRLARLLLTEVKEAAKVTLKVNPEDFAYLREHLDAGEKVAIEPDPAVGPGGVIVASDIGHIDGDIMHRFERIKEAVFGTVS